MARVSGTYHEVELTLDDHEAQRVDHLHHRSIRVTNVTLEYRNGKPRRVHLSGPCYRPDGTLDPERGNIALWTTLDADHIPAWAAALVEQHRPGRPDGEAAR